MHGERSVSSRASKCSGAPLFELHTCIFELMSGARKVSKPFIKGAPGRARVVSSTVTYHLIL